MARMKTRITSFFPLLKVAVLFLVIFTLSDPSFSSEFPPNIVTSNWFESQVKLPVVENPILDFIPTDLISFLENIPEGIALNQSVDIFLSNSFLTASEGVILKAIFSRVYEEINKDPSFYQSNPPPIFNFLPGKISKKGHYYFYSPKAEPEESIIFLHGFGGNLKFYIWAMKKAFPDSLVLFPSWGLSGESINSEYLNEIIQDASKKFGAKIKRPWLFAISGGGPGGFRIYNSNLGFFKGLISIASSPRKDQVSMIASDSKILMINGFNDHHYPIEKVRVITKEIIEKVRDFSVAEINSDHFFILTMHKETFTLIKAFMNKKR